MPPKRKAQASTAASKKKSKASSTPVVAGIVDAQAATLLSTQAQDPQVYCTPQGEVMDVMLAQVDVKSNTDKYYILQVIVDVEDTDNYFCFTRWGRTGAKGQCQLDGPVSLEEAMDFFEKKFSDKTGQEWADRKNFKQIKGKYNFLNVNHVQKATDAKSGNKAKWEYYIDDNVDGKANGWYEFTADGAENCEQLWSVYQANNLYSQRIVNSGQYDYLVDLVQMTQKNTTLPSGRTRQIRRVHNGAVTIAANSVGPISASSVVVAASSTVVINATPAATTSAAAAATTAPAASGRGRSKAAAAAVASAAPVAAAPVITPVTTAKKPTTATKTGTSSPNRRPVDPNCPLANSSSTVVIDDMDVTLNQVDLAKNANKFYRIQLLMSQGSYHVWTRWGRVGETGQSALLGPFSDKNAGIHQFESKFKDKSGNRWEDRDNFVCKSGKYDLIITKDDEEAATPAGVQSAAKTPVNAVFPPSKLHLTTQKLMELIFDQDMFKTTMASMNIDVKRMPLGALSDAQIKKGFAVLDEMKAALAPPPAAAASSGAKSKRGRKKAEDDADSSAPVAVKVDSRLLSELSSRFYQVIPHSYPRHVVPQVINSVQLLEEKYDMLSTLNDIAVAQTVVNSSASLQTLPAHPLDMKYQELKSDLELLASNDPMFDIISKYITSTKGYHNIRLENVWSVRRHPEDTTFSSFHALDNHRLLWHGTNVAVVAAILKTGLRIMPTVNGGRVGRGIYLANELNKSAGYVRTTTTPEGHRIGILFLVQAALGKMAEIYHDDPSLCQAPPGYDSVLARGTQFPDPSHNLTVHFDNKPVVVPQGNVTRGNYTSNFHQDEYLVYRESQQRLRYILTFRY